MTQAIQRLRPSCPCTHSRSRSTSTWTNSSLITPAGLWGCHLEQAHQASRQAVSDEYWQFRSQKSDVPIFKGTET
jgi:hypothetical protein